MDDEETAVGAWNTRATDPLVQPLNRGELMDECMRLCIAVVNKEADENGDYVVVNVLRRLAERIKDEAYT